MAMKRTQIYLTHDEHKAIAQLSRQHKKKRSEIIRDAIDEYIKKQTRRPFAAILDEVAGSWKDNTVDFTAIRKSWDRKIEILD